MDALNIAGSIHIAKGLFIVQFCSYQRILLRRYLPRNFSASSASTFPGLGNNDFAGHGIALHRVYLLRRCGRGLYSNDDTAHVLWMWSLWFTTSKALMLDTLGGSRFPGVRDKALTEVLVDPVEHGTVIMRFT